MPRKPDARVNEAKEMYLKGAKLIDIAKHFGISEGTVRSWKSRGKWDKKNESNVANKNNATLRKKRGAPIGNKNAVGNKGGKGGPAENKNAVVTGEYEKIMYAGLSDEEKKLLDLSNVYADSYDLLSKDIVMYTIRERRMLNRIKELEDKQGGMYVSSVVKTKTENANRSSQTTSTTASNTGHQILRIEEALSRIQRQKAQAVKMRNDILNEQERIGLDRKKAEIYIQRLKGCINVDELIEPDDIVLDAADDDIIILGND